MMEAGEVEFVAEKELITITPNFSENKITLISVRGPKKVVLYAFWGPCKHFKFGGWGGEQDIFCVTWGNYCTFQ